MFLDCLDDPFHLFDLLVGLVLHQWLLDETLRDLLEEGYLAAIVLESLGEYAGGRVHGLLYAGLGG